jgi:hypothetical protein
MQRLNPEQFARARAFLLTSARPLDRALFKCRFEAAPAEQVLAELARYQNADGGFGQALEPDLRTPSSSALCTGIGLRHLQELACPPDHPLVAGALQYLLKTFDHDQNVWRVVPRDTNQHAHAPWWHDENGSLARTFDDYVLIPRAQIVALLHTYASRVPADWLTTLTEATVESIEEVADDAFRGGGDALRYSLELAESKGLPRQFKDRVLPRLRCLAGTIVERDPRKWGEYCATPLKIAPLPGAAAADMLHDDLMRNLDYVVETQASDGAWEPTWSWGEVFPAEWERAKQEWRGHLTLEMLTTLRAYGRIDMGTGLPLMRPS